MELLYQHSEMFGREVKQISVNNYTKDTLFFDATCVRLFLYKSHSLWLIENPNKTHTEIKSFKYKYCDYRCRTKGNLAVYEKRLAKTHIRVINAVKPLSFLGKLKEVEPNLFYLLHQSVVCFAFRKIQLYFSFSSQSLHCHQVDFDFHKTFLHWKRENTRQSKNRWVCQQVVVERRD